VSSKQSHLLDRIRRARTISTWVGAVALLGVVACAVLRDLGHLTPAMYGLALTLLTITALAVVGIWCTVFVCEWDVRNVRRAEQIVVKVDQLSEVMLVAEYSVAMEADKYRGGHRANRN
jgi:Zn-dependent protease